MNHIKETLEWLIGRELSIDESIRLERLYEERKAEDKYLGLDRDCEIMSIMREEFKLVFSDESR